MTLASPSAPTVRISLMTEDTAGPVVPGMSVEADDVDVVYAVVLESGADIEHPLRDGERGGGASSSETPMAE